MITKPYFEKLRSNKTTALFVFLALVFFLLSAWRVSVVGFVFFPILCLFLGVLFLLYVVNYRTLQIEISDRFLRLKFGLVGWKIDFENIDSCSLDASPAIIKYGGAGVHFAFVNRIYRVFFNFLEYPRVLINFKRKKGLVQGLVFTTKQPDQVMEFLQTRINQL